MRATASSLAIGLAIALTCAAAGAQEPADPPVCSSFDWPLMREQAWFSAPSLPRLASGATLPLEIPGATLALRPSAEADLPFPPSRETKPDTYAGVLRVPAPLTPGLYQVTLSDEAWIDASQDGRTTRMPVAHTGKSGCPGLRKSLRFQFGPAPVILAISNAKTDSIKIAVAPVE